MIGHLCSGCETVLWSSPRLVGLPIRCEICRRNNEVPRESSADLPPHLRRRARPQPRPSLVPLVIGLVFVSAILSGMVGMVVYSLSRGPAAEDSLTLTVTTKDGRSQFSVPGDWKDLREDAEESVQSKVGSPDGSNVVEVRTEPKVGGAEELTLSHCAAQAADRLVRGTDGFLSWPQRMTLGGRPAVRYEVRCRVEGQPTAILLTVVEGSDCFHQVVGMMIGDADGDRELMERVVSTFREVR